MPTIVTDKALEGFNAGGSRCPYLATSVHSDAWHIGAWLHQTGRPAPREVRKSRGDSYRVNDMLIRTRYVDGTTQCERVN